jgi:hypothetical protein
MCPDSKSVSENSDLFCGKTGKTFFCVPQVQAASLTRQYQVLPQTATQSRVALPVCEDQNELELCSITRLSAAIKVCTGKARGVLRAMAEGC